MATEEYYDYAVGSYQKTRKPPMPIEMYTICGCEEEAVDVMTDYAVYEVRELTGNPVADGDLGSSVPLSQRKSGYHLIWLSQPTNEGRGDYQLGLYKVEEDGYLFSGDAKLLRVYFTNIIDPGDYATGDTATADQEEHDEDYDEDSTEEESDSELTEADYDSSSEDDDDEDDGMVIDDL